MEPLKQNTTRKGGKVPKGFSSLKRTVNVLPDSSTEAIHAAAAAAKSLQSCPTLCDPIDSSPPGSPVPGILQARTLEWVAVSFTQLQIPVSLPHTVVVAELLSHA